MSGTLKAVGCTAGGARAHREIVQGSPFEYVVAPRTLPTALLQRLDEIAVGNDGAVPLHGRLFAQWMHHAFPNECSYPHDSGTTSPRTAAEWMNATGETHTATADEMQSVVDRSALLPAVETVMKRSPSCRGQRKRSCWSFGRYLALRHPAALGGRPAAISCSLLP